MPRFSPVDRCKVFVFHLGHRPLPWAAISPNLAVVAAAVVKEKTLGHEGQHTSPKDTFINLLPLLDDLEANCVFPMASSQARQIPRVCLYWRKWACSWPRPYRDSTGPGGFYIFPNKPSYLTEPTFYQLFMVKLMSPPKYHNDGFPARVE